ncbi:hypothetical protein LFM09_24510 [Lentzea alba]|uniref:hypothetical protein n=1 Tax=Lentzea alba TaxID=2714351 RepID=UPI0039BFD087
MNRSLIIVALTATLGLAACTTTPQADSTPSSTTSTQPAHVVTEVVTQTVTNPPKPPNDSRPGYGALKLGMTLAEAQATGLVGTDFHVYRNCRYNDHATITDEGGVERITLPPDAKTSAGAAVGMTLTELKRLYPSVKEEALGYAVDIPGDARLLFETSDTLVPRKDGDKIAKIKLFKRRLQCMAAVF